MISEFGISDVIECPRCGREFELNNLDEDNHDDFDEYFEHVTACGRKGEVTT